MKAAMKAALVLLLLASIPLLAQASPAGAQPSASPTLTFDLRWPDSDPQWFQLVFQADGSARYRSLPHVEEGSQADPDPYEFSFTLSQRSRERVAAIAPKLQNFRGTLDRVRVAFTGSKTIRYQDDSGSSSISYNYTSAPELSSFTDLMLGISSTIELRRDLESELRFDKLAIDGTLRHVDELLSLHRLDETQILQPVLRRIVEDREVLNMARQRASRILESTSVLIRK
jgi:hypothetical protein